MVSFQRDINLVVFYLISEIEVCPDKRDVLIRGVVSFQRDNLVVFYLTSVFEFWSDKRVALGGIDLIHVRGGADCTKIRSGQSQICFT